MKLALILSVAFWTFSVQPSFSQLPIPSGTVTLSLPFPMINPTLEASAVVMIDGCTDPDACNYDSLATDDDGSCMYVDAFILSWSGETSFCTSDGISDLFAPGIINNGNSGQNSAFVLTDELGDIIYAGGTFYVEFEGTSPGICNAYSVNYQNGLIGLEAGLNLADLVGCFDVSEPIIITKVEGGCTDPEACNFDSTATCPDDSCEYPCPGFDCSGECIDANQNEVCDLEEANLDIAGCTDSAALNYYAVFTVDDGSCLYAQSLCSEGTFWDGDIGMCVTADDPCPGDFDDNGLVNTVDLLIFLPLYGVLCEE